MATQRYKHQNSIYIRAPFSPSSNRQTAMMMMNKVTAPANKALVQRSATRVVPSIPSRVVMRAEPEVRVCLALCTDWLAVLSLLCFDVADRQPLAHIDITRPQLHTLTGTDPSPSHPRDSPSCSGVCVVCGTGCEGAMAARLSSNLHQGFPLTLMIWPGCIIIVL